ncbi:MAG: Gfo/Idh/MocA family oxidoreductase [Candidatus Latescibacteria bacterium]|nr:Gfo/Idh/MocA family oxidoreductase [Candidatus Latescibacterota bacterium]
MLRGVIVGFGRMGLTHYSILNNHPDVKFVAICDSSKFILKSAAKYLDLETYLDSDKMIQEIKPDFVLVATPSAQHSNCVSCALKNDAHVFVEKPFAVNLEEGRRLAEYAKEKGLINQVGYVCRFNDVFMRVKSLLKSNVIGELLNFKVEMYSSTVIHASETSWRSKKNEGGGCLYDIASHGIDLINFLIGPPDKIKGSVLQSIYSQGVEDAVYSTYSYKNGATGNLIVNWSDPTYRKLAYRFEILGNTGKIIADLHAFKLYLNDTSSDSEFSEGWNHRYITDFAEPVRFYVRGNEFTRQLDYFIDCILKKQISDMCSFKEGLTTDIVIDQIRNDFNTRGH